MDFALAVIMPDDPQTVLAPDAKGGRATVDLAKIPWECGFALLNEFEVAAVLGQSVGTIRNYRVDGRGPQFLKLNGTTVRYRISALRTYLDAQPAGGGPVDAPMQRRRRGRPRKAGGSAA